MKEKYYEELLIKFHAWKKYADGLDGMFKDMREYETYVEHYTKLTKDLCAWLKVFQAASKDEWQEDKITYKYLFAIDDEFLNFLNKINQED